MSNELGPYLFLFTQYSVLITHHRWRINNNALQVYRASRCAETGLIFWVQFAIKPDLKPHRCQRSGRYRTGSRSDRIQALNYVLPGPSAGELSIARLNVGSGRYRSRFCNHSPRCVFKSMKSHQCGYSRSVSGLEFLPGGRGANSTSRKFRGSVSHTIKDDQIIFGVQDFVDTRQPKRVICK